MEFGASLIADKDLTDMIRLRMTDYAHYDDGIEISNNINLNLNGRFALVYARVVGTVHRPVKAPVCLGATACDDDPFLAKLNARARDTGRSIAAESCPSIWIPLRPHLLRNGLTPSSCHSKAMFPTCLRGKA